MIKATLATVTFMIIATQTVHSYYIIDSFSRIKIRWLRIFQNVMFCGIISLFILVMVFMGEHEMALAGAILESLLNIYYFFEDWWQKGYGAKADRKLARIRFWRKNWFKIIMALAIPALIYGCSYFMTKPL
jgi:hypothetical protein